MNRCISSGFPPMAGAVQRMDCPPSSCRPACFPCCGSCVPPIPVPPVCPPCPSCPTCPTPIFPNVACTTAFENIVEQLIEIPLTSVTLPDAFTASDGPPPYTVLTAAFMTLQMPLIGLAFSPTGAEEYTLSAAVAPFLLVTYLDGTGVQRAKLVQIPLALTATVVSPVDPSSANWWAFLESGSVADPVATGNALSLMASGTIQMLAVPSLPENYPVLQDYGCSQQPPVQARCVSLRMLETYCQVSGGPIGTNLNSIPLTPLGPPPYTNAAATPLGGKPYVIRVGAPSFGATPVDLAFPITMSYMDGNGQSHSQPAFLLMALLINGLPDDAQNAPIMMDVTIDAIFFPETSFTTTPLHPAVFSFLGHIAVVGAAQSVLVTDTVQCGAPVVSACALILPPPTAE